MCDIYHQTLGMRHQKFLFACFCLLLSLSSLKANPHFRANAGQWAPPIYFGLHAGPASIAFLADGVSWNLRSDLTSGTSYQTRFLGVRQDLYPVGEYRLPAKIRYLQASSSPLETHDFAAVRYPEAWQGIDIVYYHNGPELKYDIEVEAGADPSQIRISLEELEQVEVLKDGRLRLHTVEGIFHEAPPYTYQVINGQTREVPSRYRLNRNCELEFEFPDGFDAGQALIIDPVAIEWSTYIGGNSYSSLTDHAMDEAGNIYAVGNSEMGFPVTPGALDTSFNGNFPSLNDAVIIKMDPTGSNLIWATYLGGTFAEYANSIALDPDGNVYVTGRTYSANFPVTSGVFQPVHADSGFFNYDLFVSKISPNGDALLYSTFYGGFGDDYAGAIDVNAEGEVFVGGYTNGGDIPTTSGAFDRSFNGAIGFSDAFVFRLNADASSLIYSTFVGGSQSESAIEIIVNDQNEASFTGEVSSFDFPTTPNAVFSNKTGTSACTYAARLSADGTQLLASTYLCGNRGDYGEGMDLNQDGDFYLTGRTYSDIFPLTPGSYDSTVTGDADVFVARISADASQLIYSTYFGDLRREIGTGIQVNDRGEIFVTGNTGSLDFPTTDCAIDTFCHGAGSYWGGDVFLFKLDSSGENLLYSTLIGGSSDELLPDLILDDDACTRSVVIGVSTSSLDYPTTPGAFQEQFHSNTGNQALTRITETIDAEIVMNEDSCPSAGNPFAISVQVNGCGYWSDMSKWVWDFGDGQTSSDSALTHTYSSNGSYTITLRRPGCPGIIDQRTVNIFGVDLGPDLQLCRGDKMVLNAYTPEANSYLWYDGSTQPTHLVDKSGTIYVDVWDSEGCIATDSVEVTLLGEDDIQVPNAFSPNNDGINDNFFVTGLEGNKWTLEVYDRWGASRYSSVTYQNNWNGGDLPEGVYYYVLKSNSGCGVFSGNVTLVR